MSENASGNSTLYFLVGGLLVAVIGVGYFAMGRGDHGAMMGRGYMGGGASVSRDAGEESGTSVELDVNKQGGVSGTAKQE